MIALLQTAPADAPWLYVGLAGAISALWGVVVWLGKGSIDRCEARDTKCRERIDALLVADAEKTAALKEANVTAARATELAERSITATGGAVAAAERNGGKLDAVTATLADIRRTLDDLARDRERTR